MNQKQIDRVDHIFLFMEYSEITDDQHSLVIKYEDYYKKNGYLTDRQMEVLESIFKQAAEK